MRVVDGKKLFIPDSDEYKEEEYDTLDFATMYVYEKKSKLNNAEISESGLRSADFKKWDFPVYDDAILGITGMRNEEG